MARSRRTDRGRSRTAPAGVGPAAARPVSAGRRWTPARIAIAALGIVGITALIINGVIGWNDSRAVVLERECRRARDAQQWGDEVRLAEAWLRVAPSASKALVFLAQGYLGLERKQEAADTLARLPDGDPLTVPSLIERADLLFGDLRQPHEAAANCARILAQRSLSLEAAVEARKRLCFYYAATLQRTRLAEEARLAIELGCELPETYIYRIGSDWLTLSNTMSVNSHWLQEAPDDELFLVAAARGYVSNKGLEEDVAGDAEATGNAEAAGDGKAPPVQEHDRRLAELLERFPGNLELLAYFLQKATTKGDIDRVAELLAQSPPEAENDNRFWRFKGWVHTQQGEGDLAAAAYRRALVHNPYDFSTQHQFAGVLRKEGNLPEAARLAALAAKGRALRKMILELPDVRSIPPEVQTELEDYARGCGDGLTADRIASRRRLAAASGEEKSPRTNPLTGTVRTKPLTPVEERN